MEMMDRAVSVSDIEGCRGLQRVRQVPFGGGDAPGQRHARHQRGDGRRQGASRAVEIVRSDARGGQHGDFSIA